MLFAQMVPEIRVKLFGKNVNCKWLFYYFCMFREKTVKHSKLEHLNVFQ